MFYECRVPEQREEGLKRAVQALKNQQLVVFPTDTLYGIAADAFAPKAVERLLSAKGRDKSMPPPVFLPHVEALEALASDVSDDVRALARRFWPGALTIICRVQPSLHWDLGQTRGTVALRLPDDEIARTVASAVGPLAVSSANLTRQPTPETAKASYHQLGASVEIYLDDGVRPQGGSPQPSTIVDATQDPITVVRAGALALDTLRETVPSLRGLDPSNGMASSIRGDSAKLNTANASAHASRLQE